MSLSVGDKLGPYEILSRIGAGGTGEVYRAHDAVCEAPAREHSVVFVMNFFEELRRRVPINGR